MKKKQARLAQNISSRFICKLLSETWGVEEIPKQSRPRSKWKGECMERNCEQHLKEFKGIWINDSQSYFIMLFVYVLILYFGVVGFLFLFFWGGFVVYLRKI